MSSSYDVWVNLHTSGNLTAQLNAGTSSANAFAAAADLIGQRATAATGTTIRGLENMGHAIGQVTSHAHNLIAPLEAIVEKGLSLTASLAELGVATGIGVLTYGVTVLNKELENTQITLATIFNAQGMTANIDAGMGTAAETMKQMRKDAAALPGEFDDLRKILMTVATPALASGMSIDKLREFSARTMAVGAVMGIRSDQTAREAAMLLEGRAGGHNVLGMRLGFMGEKAHKLKMGSAEERAAMVSAELAKYAPSIDKFQTSFEGITSTTVSNVKLVAAQMSGPLFESVKKTFSEINNWYDRNETRVQVWADKIGYRVADAWEWGKKKIEEWYPAIETFSENAYNYVVGIWEKAEPYVVRISDAIKEMFKDPGTFDKITHILELYAAMKVGGAAGGVAMDVLGVAGGIGNIASAGKAMGWWGQAASAAGGTASVAGVASAGSGLMGSGLMGSAGAVAGEAAFGTGAIAAAGGGLSGLIAVAVPVAAAIGSLGMAAWQATELYGDIQKSHKQNSDAWVEAGQRAINTMTLMDYANEDYQSNLHKLIESGDTLGASLLMAAAAAKEFANIAPGSGHQAMADALSQRNTDYLLSTASVAAAQALSAADAAEAKRMKDRKTAAAGHGGVHINQVQVTVTSNNDPSRVAMEVADIFTRWRRNRRSSPDAPNWSSTTPVST